MTGARVMLHDWAPLIWTGESVVATAMCVYLKVILRRARARMESTGDKTVTRTVVWWEHFADAAGIFLLSLIVVGVLSIATPSALGGFIVLVLLLLIPLWVIFLVLYALRIVG